MKALPWIVAGVTIGVIVTLLLRLSEPEREPARESDGVETVAPKRYGWGTKTLIGGRVGAVQESTGRVSSNDRKFAGPGVPLHSA